jgi:hypothetical protein
LWLGRKFFDTITVFGSFDPLPETIMNIACTKFGTAERLKRQLELDDAWGSKITERCHDTQCCGAETICFGSSSGSAFKKFSLRLQLKLCGYLFLQLLNEKVDF